LERKILTWILLFFLVFPLLATPLSSGSPSWLKKGAYVKYGSSSTAFRWECIDIDGNMAELNWSYSVNDTILRSAVVRIDIQNRTTYLSNGTYLGKTVLWLPADPVQDEMIEVSDNNSYKAEVRGWVFTIQGAQKIFYFYRISGFWDLDTGILLEADDDQAFAAAGFPSFQGFKIVETNIDLGPREWLPEIIYALPYLLPIIAFLVVFIFLLRRSQRKKKQREMLMSKQRKLQGK